MEAAPLTLADFTPLVGRPLDVDSPHGPLQLVLSAAGELPPSPREGGSFRLEFEGPLEPELEQGIYAFGLDGRPTDIFIVPIARTADAMQYEAIFF